VIFTKGDYEGISNLDVFPIPITPFGRFSFSASPRKVPGACEGDVIFLFHIQILNRPRGRPHNHQKPPPPGDDRFRSFILLFVERREMRAGGGLKGV
jgi:hypothetical protein